MNKFIAWHMFLFTSIKWNELISGNNPCCHNVLTVDLLWTLIIESMKWSIWSIWFISALVIKHDAEGWLQYFWVNTVMSLCNMHMQSSLIKNFSFFPDTTNMYVVKTQIVYYFVFILWLCLLLLLKWLIMKWDTSSIINIQLYVEDLA